MSANWFATFALLCWPLVALWLYSTQPTSRATLWTILGAQLLLPVGIGIKLSPGIPELDKTSIPNLAAAIGCILVGGRLLRLRNGFGLAEVLSICLLIGPLITSELNGDVLFVGGGTVLPSVGHYDA